MTATLTRTALAARVATALEGDADCRSPKFGNAAVRAAYQAAGLPALWDTDTASAQRKVLAALTYGGDLPSVIERQLAPETATAPTPASAQPMPSANRVTTDTAPAPRLATPTAAESQHDRLLRALRLLTDAGELVQQALGESPVMAKVRTAYSAVRDAERQAHDAVAAERKAKTPPQRPVDEAAVQAIADQAKAADSVAQATPAPAEKPQATQKQAPAPASPAQPAPTAKTCSATKADGTACKAKPGPDGLCVGHRKQSAKNAATEPAPHKPAVTLTVDAAKADLLRQFAALSVDQLQELAHFIPAL